MKKVLSIAGSDCSGGAGIQADLKTFSAHGVFGMSVIVSVVAENTSRVIDIQDITPDMIAKQIDAVFEDIEVNAVKIGMLSTPECMKAVAMKLLQYKPQNIVIDPVMYAKNGCPLMNPAAVSTLIDTVIPLADVLTPNIPEAEKIADMQISTVSDMEAAARKIYAMGCKAIVVKGGHHIGNAVDVLFDGENFHHFETYEKYSWDRLYLFFCNRFPACKGKKYSACCRSGKGLCHNGNRTLPCDWKRLWPDAPFLRIVSAWFI